MAQRSLLLLDTGPQALIEDLGRPGYAHLGVAPSGALDVPALRLANRLVGNLESAAGVELVLGGLRLRAQVSCTVAVTGPAAPIAVNSRSRGTHLPLHLGIGDVLTVGPPEAGLRNYLAVSGGIEVPAELGSRSTDLLSGIGPAPLRPGDTLPLGTRYQLPAGADELAPAPVPDELLVPVLIGPREDWFTDPAGQLADGVWRVSPDSNRVGLRLIGPALRRAPEFTDVELPSEPVLTGAVQIPASGRPVLFLADHPATGGYPVIGVVAPAALPLLGQARPGTTVRLRPIGQPAYSDS